MRKHGNGVNLTRAVAGEGHRITATGKGKEPSYLRPFLLDVPERPRERVGRIDLYAPDLYAPDELTGAVQRRCPAVVSSTAARSPPT